MNMLYTAAYNKGNDKNIINLTVCKRYYYVSLFEFTGKCVVYQPLKLIGLAGTSNSFINKLKNRLFMQIIHKPTCDYSTNLQSQPFV